MHVFKAENYFGLGVMDKGLSSTVTFGQDQQSNIFTICESKAT